jgi:MFS transporter, OFA family, oxalate/formate antiporter
MLKYLSSQFQLYRQRINYGYIVAISSTIIFMVVWGTYYSYGIFFKPLLTEFGWTRALTSGAFSLCTIISGVVAIPAGRLTDRFGARPVVTTGGVLVGIGYILMCQTGSIWQLYIFYGILVGAGTGFHFVPLLSNVAHWFPDNRGLMTGLVLSGIGLGTFIGPIAANHLISLYDWRSSYIIFGVIVMAVSVLLAQLLKRISPTIPVNNSSSYINGDVSSPAGILFRAAIWTHQIWMVSALFLCLGCCLFAIILHIVPYATDQGFTPAESAVIISVIGILSIIGKISTGYLADRIGSRPGWVIGFIIMATALIYLLSVDTLWGFYAFAMAFGFAYGGLVAMESTIIADLFGLRSHGTILGLANTMFTVGAAIGPWLAGYFYDTTLSYRLAFIILGSIAVIGIIVAVFLKPLTNQINTVNE